MSGSVESSDSDQSYGDSGAWALMALFSWLVPHVFIAIAEARWEISSSNRWNGEKLEQGLIAIRNFSILAIGVASTITIATAIGVSVATRGLDANMLYFLSGMSRLASAVIIFVISLKIPRWLRLYSDGKNDYDEPIGDSLKVLRFNIRWSIWKRFFEVYFVLLPFYSGGRQSAWGILISMFIGIIGGFVVCLAIHHGRVGWKERKASISFAMITILILFSNAVFVSGVWYIYHVWEVDSPEEWNQVAVGLVCFFGWVVIGVVIHLSIWACSKRKEEGGEEDEEEEKGENSDTDRDDEWQEEETAEVKTSSLLKNKFCCCCGNDMPPIGKLVVVLKWIIWAIASGLCLYLVIINIAATYQADVATKNYPITSALFYDQINQGKVCAFQNTGDGGPYNVTTFSSAEEAQAADWTIAHCGECAACSSWPNLEVYWATRNTLATLSRNCAKKLLFGASYQEALLCHTETIGFDSRCSSCWVDDEICATKNCAFTYLQSQIINSVGNFTVAPGAVTTASCDEAMCGQKFLPCVGANRRTMNIQSDIQGPENQQCSIVDPQQWEEFFGSTTSS